MKESRERCIELNGAGLESEEKKRNVKPKKINADTKTMTHF